MEEAKQKFKATKEEQEKKRLLSPPSKEEEIVLLKERNAKLEGYLFEENVLYIHEDVLASIKDQRIEESRGDQQIDESRGDQ